MISFIIFPKTIAEILQRPDSIRSEQIPTLFKITRGLSSGSHTSKHEGQRSNKLTNNDPEENSFVKGTCPRMHLLEFQTEIKTGRV